MAFPIEIYDRPNIALSNLTSGNLPAAGQSLFDPMGLAPDEMQSFQEIWQESRRCTPRASALGPFCYSR